MEVEIDMIMATACLSKDLPKPKNQKEYEVLPNRAQHGRPRIVEEGALLKNQIVLKVCGGMG